MEGTAVRAGTERTPGDTPQCGALRSYNARRRTRRYGGTLGGRCEGSVGERYSPVSTGFRMATTDKDGWPAGWSWTGRRSTVSGVASLQNLTHSGDVAACPWCPAIARCGPWCDAIGCPGEHACAMPTNSENTQVPRLRKAKMRRCLYGYLTGSSSLPGAALEPSPLLAFVQNQKSLAAQVIVLRRPHRGR